MNRKDYLSLVVMVLILPSISTFLYGKYLTRTYEFYDFFKFSVTDLNTVNKYQTELKGILGPLNHSIDSIDRIGDFTKISPNFIRYNVLIQVPSNEINLFIKPRERKINGIISAIFPAKMECYKANSIVATSSDWRIIIPSVKLSSTEISDLLINFKCVVQSNLDSKRIPTNFDYNLYDVQPTLSGGIEIKPDSLSYIFVYLISIGAEITLLLTLREILRISRGRRRYFLE